MNGASLFAAALENEGVKQIFGVPEEEAAFMAATHGQLTGEAGVCLSTLGPGALNLTTGAVYAQFGALPMVMITGHASLWAT